jgi:hypothetical protein
MAISSRFGKEKNGSKEQVNRKDFPNRGIKPVSELDAILLITFNSGPQNVELRVFRQSGNVERVEVYPNVVEALKATKTIFARMREQEVRIWANDSNFADVRRNYYSAKGRSEGKKISGVSLRLL